MKQLSKVTKAGSFHIAAMVGGMMMLGALPASAQNAPSCIASLKKEFGSTGGVKAECQGKRDCTFLAPTGNASARALLETIAKRAEDCFTKAGWSAANEEKADLGTTREFQKAGAETKCALLISTPSGTPPEGVRVLCN